MRRLRLLAAAASVALAASSCQLRLATDVAVDADLEGTFAVVVALDGELRRALEEAGADPLAELDDLTARAPGWTVTPREAPGGGLELRLSTRFAGPEGFAAATGELHGALDDEDPRLFDRLSLRRVDGGAVAFEGAVGLLLPSSAGARGAGVAFDGEDLQRLLEERGDELVRYDVRVTLPAPPREHDADQVDGRSLTWRAPVGELRDVHAVSGDPGPPRWAVLAATATGGALVGAAAVTALSRRRRSWAGQGLAR